jgi:hypothetical protein
MSDHAFPPGWEKGRTGEYIAHRELEEYLYAKIRYDVDKDQYVLISMCCDGPKQINELGRYDTVGAAFRAGDKL